MSSSSCSVVVRFVLQSATPQAPGAVVGFDLNHPPSSLQTAIQKIDAEWVGVKSRRAASKGLEEQGTFAAELDAAGAAA